MPGPERLPSCTRISPELSRRELLVAGACALGAAALWPRFAFAADEPAWLAAARTSPLVYVSPLLADGKLYLTNEDALTTVVKAGPAFERLAENPLDGFTVSSPAAASGQLFLRTREALYCIGGKSP